MEKFGSFQESDLKSKSSSGDMQKRMSTLSSGDLQKRPSTTLNNDRERVKSILRASTSEYKTGPSESVLEFRGFLQAEQKPRQSYNYFSVFRYSTGCEKFFIIIGLMAAIASGVSVPLMVYEFGALSVKMVIIGLWEQFHHRVLDPNETDVCNDVCLEKANKFFNPNVTDRDPPYCENHFTALLLNKSNQSNGINVFVSEVIFGFSFNSMGYSAALTICSAIYFSCLYICADKLIVRLSMEYMEALLRKDMKWLDVRADRDFGNVVIENTQKIREGVGERIGIGISFCSVFIFSLILAFLNGWELALIACVSIPLLVVCTALIASTEAKLLLAEEKSFANCARLAEEVFLNISSVFVYGGQKQEFSQFVEQIESKNKHVFKATIYSCLANALSWCATYLNYAMTFYFGTKFVLGDQVCEGKQGNVYTPESLVCVFFAIMFGSMNIGLAFPIVQSLFVTTHATKEVLHTINSDVEIDNLSEDGIVLPIEQIKGQFSFEDIYFTYPARPERPILNGITFQVSPGMTCAIVGYSGSGKSTLLKLLDKEYLCDSGFIKFDGVDVRYHNTQWLRRQIAVVPQDLILFDDTVEQNVRMGFLDASFEQIKEACLLANAHDFIMNLSNGYQTNVGFAGCNLSSGQRQRICIARAFIRKAKILLLDEWSAGLDSKSEKLIQEYLQETSNERTTFVVADKLSTTINADMILVLKKGKIVEQGTHKELLSLKKVYYELATRSMNKPARIQQQRKSIPKIEPIKRLLPVNTIKVFGVKGDLTKMESIREQAKAVKSKMSTTSDMTYKIITKDVNSTAFSPEEQIKYQFKENKFEKAKNLWAVNCAKEPIESKVSNIPENKKYGFCTIIKLVSEGGGGLITVGIIATIVTGAVLPVYGILFGFAIGALGFYNKKEAEDASAQYSLLFLLVGLAAGVAVFIQHLSLNLGGTRAVKDTRKRLFFSMMRQDIGWFENPKNDITTLNGVLTGDAGSTQYIIFTFYGVIIECVASIGIAIFYSATFGDPLLTVYSLGLIPLVVGASFLDNWFAKRQEKDVEETFYKVAKLVNEMVENTRVVTTCQLERYFLQRYNSLIEGPSGYGLTILRSFAYGFAQSAVFWSYSICMILSIDRINNEVPYEKVLITGDNMVFSLLNVGASLAILPLFSRALNSAHTILQILNRKPAIDIDAGGDFVDNVKGDINFENVDFNYPYLPDIPVLRDVNWSVKAGQTVALVGGSGSGKSTVNKLILKFYNPTSGVVSIDGRDITKLNCASFLSHVGVVEPEPRLFNRSIAENIAYGLNHRLVDISEIMHCAKAANIHTFITSLPEGYNTKVGSSGSLMSAGQKQRIAIARALLRNPGILILDEPTSALDHENEGIVLKSLDAGRVGRSCVTISHRLFTIKDADLIVVLEQGFVEEIGTHLELLEKGGLYASLWEAQNPMIS